MRGLIITLVYPICTLLCRYGLSAAFGTLHSQKLANGDPSHICIRG
jgi:hypothetical protein